MKLTIVFLGLLLASASVYAGGYMEPASVGWVKNNFCMVNAACTLSALNIDSLVVQNLSILGDVFNVTMIHVNWTITDSFNVGGNLTAQDITAQGSFFGNINRTKGEHWVNESYEVGNQTFAQTVDEENIELRLVTTTNDRSYLYFMESDSNILGYRIWYDGHGGGTLKIDAIDGAGNIIPKIELDRDDSDMDFFVDEDLNDNNITNVRCILMSDGVQLCNPSPDVFVIGNSDTGDAYIVIDDGVIHFYNDTVHHETMTIDYLNSSGTVQAESVNISFIQSNNHNSYLEIRGDPWWLSGAGFQADDFFYQNGLSINQTTFSMCANNSNNITCYINENGQWVLSINISIPKAITDSNASTACDDGEYLDGSGLCILFNDTVSEIFEETQVIYNATSVHTAVGTLDGGSLSSIQGLPDREYYNVSEVTGTPGFTIYVNFTNVIAFNVVALAGQYIGGSGHTVELELYRVGVGWEEREEITDQTKEGITTFDVFIGGDFIDGDGTVQFRINHDDSGNINHDYLVDTVLIGQVSGIVVGGDLDDLTGRDEACILLPDVFCRDGSKNVTGKLNTSKLRVNSLSNCDTINTTADGTLVCGNDADSGGSAFDPSTIDYVNHTQLDNATIVRNHNTTWLDSWYTGVSPYGNTNFTTNYYSITSRYDSNNFTADASPYLQNGTNAYFSKANITLLNVTTNLTIHSSNIWWNGSGICIGAC